MAPACRYVHPVGQTCPCQLFQIPLSLKDYDRAISCIVLDHNTSNDALYKEIARLNMREIGWFSRSTSGYYLSDRLYIVSGDLCCISALDLAN